MFRYFFLLISFVPLAMMAQGRKGDWLLNGKIKFDHFTSNDFYKSYGTYDFHSQAGYYFVKGVAAGAIVELVKQGNIGTDFTFTPFIRANLVGKRVSPFAQFSTGKEWRKFKRQSGFDQKRFQINLRAGLAILLGETTTLDLYFNYLANHKLSTPQGTYSYDPRFTFGLGMNYFLLKNKDNADSVALVENYLKRGNKSLGIEGASIQKDVFFSRLFWSLHISDHTRISANWNSFIGQFNDTPLLFLDILSIDLKQYFKIRGNTYLAATFGTDISFFFEPSALAEIDGRFFVHAQPNLVHFFKNSVIDIGVNIRSPIKNKLAEGEFRILANTILGYEYFISRRLAVRGELWGLLSGSNWIDDSLVFWDPVGATHFQFGFRYFYQKQHKN